MPNDGESIPVESSIPLAPAPVNGTPGIASLAAYRDELRNQLAALEMHRERQFLAFRQAENGVRECETAIVRARGALEAVERMMGINQPPPQPRSNRVYAALPPTDGKPS